MTEAQRSPTMVRVPPAALLLFTAALMWLAARQASVLDLPLPLNLHGAGFLALAGSLTCLAGVRSFVRAKTTVNPLHPESTSVLVTSGVYQFSRNPMYLGFALILLGWALFLSNGIALIFPPAFVLFLDRFQIRPEEHALLSRFGAAYRDYQSNVRRWL